MTSCPYWEPPIPRDVGQGQIKQIEIDHYLSGKDTCRSTLKDLKRHGRVPVRFPRAALLLMELISSAAATSSARVSPARVRAKICIALVLARSEGAGGRASQPGRRVPGALHRTRVRRDHPLPRLPNAPRAPRLGKEKSDQSEGDFVSSAKKRPDLHPTIGCNLPFR